MSDIEGKGSDRRAMRNDLRGGGAHGASAECGAAAAGERSRDERHACSPEAARMITARSDASSARGHTKRERVALGVFACLLLTGAVALFSYIDAGHGLNVAATSIDDIAGDMSGYGVILFEGTVDSNAASASEGEGGVQELISGIFGTDEAADDAQVSGDDSSTTGDAAPETSLSVESSSGNGVDSATTNASASGARRLGSGASAITLEEAEETYREKGAFVISIDSGNLEAYAAGRIVMQGGRTYGIFSLTPEDVATLSHGEATTTRITTTTTEDAAGSRVTSTTTRTRSAYSSVAEMFADLDQDDVDPELDARIETMLEHFEECGVDTVIALTPDPTPFYFVEGVDVVVTFKQGGRFSMGETIGSTMYFDAPEVGQVGVLMVAPGNVVSAKVMKGD